MKVLLMGLLEGKIPVLEVSEMRAAYNQVPYSLSSTGQDRTGPNMG